MHLANIIMNKSIHFYRYFNKENETIVYRITVIVNQRSLNLQYLCIFLIIYQRKHYNSDKIIIA